MKIRRKHAILTLALALLAVIPALVDAAEGSKAQPRAEIDEPVFDAGTVLKGDQIDHTFVIKNTGDADLRIESVDPACGCTVADYDEVIPAGGSGNVEATLDTTDFNGGISKSMTVRTNDPKSPRLLLTIKAEVELSVYIRPGFARFVQSQGSGVGNVEQLLYTRDFEGLKIEKVESPYDFVEVEVREATEEERVEDAKGQQYVVDVRLDYDAAPVGALADYVRVHTNHPKQEQVTVPVSGFVRPLYVLTPDKAAFGDVEVEEDGTWAAVLLKNYSNQDMAPELEPATYPDGIEVKLVPVEEGREYKVEITLGDDLAKGEFNDVIRLKTGLEKQPTIEIPLTGTRI